VGAGSPDHRPQSQSFHGERRIFGFFESEDDPAQSACWPAREWTFQRGAQVLRGPVNPPPITSAECSSTVSMPTR
jgi:hypothetical protein